MNRDGVVHGMPEGEYHRGPEFSSTEARRILDSPARFAWHREHPQPPTSAMDVGTLVHSKVLGVGARPQAYPAEHLTPSGNLSTKAETKAWLAAQREAGAVFVAPADLAVVDAMAESILKHPTARPLVENGQPEVSVFADVDGVRCRARFDRLHDGLAVDVKTTSGSASQHGFGAVAAKYGYPIQEAFYADVLQMATGERVPMKFVVVEKRAPYLVAVHELDEVTRVVARDLASRARRIYAECRDRDEWPGYGDDVIETRMPNWWVNQLDDDIEIDMEVAV